MLDEKDINFNNLKKSQLFLIKKLKMGSEMGCKTELEKKENKPGIWPQVWSPNIGKSGSCLELQMRYMKKNSGVLICLPNFNSLMKV